VVRAEHVALTRQELRLERVRVGETGQVLGDRAFFWKEEGNTNVHLLEACRRGADVIRSGSA
jgi:hypothetical protein